VFVRVHVEHEVDERPFQAGTEPPAHGEAGTGDLGGPLEVQDAEVLSHLPVVLGGEVVPPLLAPAPHHQVVGRIGSHRDTLVGYVGDLHGHGLHGRLHVPDPRVEVLDLIGDAAHLGLFPLQVSTLALGLGDLHGKLVSRRLELLGLLDEAPALVVLFHECIKSDGCPSVFQGCLY